MKTDFSKVEYLTYEEGTCLQCKHIGSYDDEPAIIAAMHDLAAKQGYEPKAATPRDLSVRSQKVCTGEM